MKHRVSIIWLQRLMPPSRYIVTYHILKMKKFSLSTRYKYLIGLTSTFLLVGLISIVQRPKTNQVQPISGAPPYGISESEIPPLTPWQQLRRDWQRPSGPPKVALQIGHLDNHLVPEELNNLRGNTGAEAGGYTEVEVNQAIAEKVAQLLEPYGVEVELIPTVVPVDYWADAFIAIHADGNLDPNISGFKIAAPWRDLTGRAHLLVETLEQTYQQATGMNIDPNITRNMRGYYAFSWWRFDHAIHPMTPAVIVETGFLTNRQDREMITRNNDIPAQALADGILEYLLKSNLL